VVLRAWSCAIARRLGESGAEVIAIDKDEERVSAIRDHVSIAVRLNATDERSLREQGVDKVDVAVVGMGESFEATQLTTVVLKGLGVKRVIVKSVDPLHEEIMRRIGADEVVSPEKEAAYRLAQVLLAPRLLDYIQLSEGHCLVQINAPEKFYGKTIRELDVRNVFSVNIVAIKKRKETGRDEAGKPVYEEKLVDIPRPTDVIDVSDVLVVIGEDADISRLAR
jgi:trk/ktr system potassium uptake protein